MDGGTVVLNVVALRDGKYLISSVALGIDEYYLGMGEAPGTWDGTWSKELSLVGVVKAPGGGYHYVRQRRSDHPMLWVRALSPRDQ